MHDQAQILRGLMDQRHEVPAERTAPGPRARTIAITSGKGGVGKSHLALNLAIALRQIGHRVGLLDANLGLGNIDLLCGLNGYWNLSHVISGARTVEQITLQGPAGIHVIPGASGLTDVADCPPAPQREILAQLESLEHQHDFLVIDTGTGIHRTVRQFVASADVILVLTTPEPTSIADAYATIKALSTTPHLVEPQVIVNQATSPEFAREVAHRIQHTARTFLQTPVGSLGSIPFDPHVPEAVLQRIPFLISHPTSPASRAIEQLAHKVITLSQRQTIPHHFFAQFATSLHLTPTAA